MTTTQKIENMTFIGDIKNASLYLDEEQNLLYVDTDSSEGFYFDEQDLDGFSDNQKEEITDLIKKTFGF